MKLKNKAIIASIITILPLVYGLLALGVLDSSITEKSGNEMWKSAAWVTVFLSAFMLVLNVVCTIFTLKDNKGRQNPKVLSMVLWICPFISIFSSFSIWTVVFEKDIDLFVLMPIILGAAFILMGNYMPKCTPNRTIGIKVKWALANEENWVATHRFGGKVFVACGVLFALSALLKSTAVILAILVLVLVFSMIPFLYSYLYYKKQVKNGTWKEDTNLQIPQKAKTIAIIGVVIVLALCAVLTFTGEIKIYVTDDEIEIEADYWSDMEIEFEDIKSVEYREEMDGQRVSGIASHRLLVGYFKNKEFGTHTRYTYTSCDGFIVVTTDEGKIVFNTETEEETVKLFEKLKEKVK